MIPLTSNSEHQVTHSWPIWLATIIGLAGVLAWPAMSAPILLDDLDTFQHVAGFNGWADVFKADVFGLFRPIKTSIYYAFSQQETLDLKLWHSMVLSSFLLSIGAVFGMLRRLLRSDTGALIGCAMWALTPTQACLAVWMSCINISLCVAFLCLFVVFHLKATQGQEKQRYSLLVGTAALLLAQFSYETAVSGIAIAILIDFFLDPNRALSRKIRPYVFYGVVTAIFLGIRHWAGASVEAHNHNLGFEPDLEPWKQSLSAPWFTQQHLLMWLIPLGRVEFASTYLWGKSASVLDLILAWTFMLGLLGTAWWIRRSAPFVALGITWFLAALFPCSNLVPISSGPIDDYYLILPSIGLVIAVVGLLQNCLGRIPTTDSPPSSRRAIFMTLAASLLLWRASLIPFFALQCNLWNTPLELFSRSAATRDYQFLSKTLVARELYQSQHFQEAVDLASEAIEDAPWHIGALVVKALSLSQLERYDEALDSFRLVLESGHMDRKFYPTALLEIARIHGKRGDDWQLSRDTLMPILEGGTSEYQIKAIHLLADIYASRDMNDRAVATLQKGIQLYPEHAEFGQQLASIEAR